MGILIQNSSLPQKGNDGCARVLFRPVSICFGFKSYNFNIIAL